MIYVIATLRVRPEKLSECLAAARVVIAATRKEDGCIFYDLHQSVTDPDQLVFVERWTSTEALGRHFQAPHMTVWRAAGDGSDLDIPAGQRLPPQPWGALVAVTAAILLSFYGLVRPFRKSAAG